MAINLLICLTFVFIQCWEPPSCLQAQTVHATVGSAVNLSAPITCPQCQYVSWFWKVHHNCSGKAEDFQQSVTALNSSHMSRDPSFYTSQRRLHILADRSTRIDGVEFTDVRNLTCDQKSNESLIDALFQLIAVKVGAVPRGPLTEGQTMTLFCRVSLALSVPSIVRRNSANSSHPENASKIQASALQTVRNIRPGEDKWKCVIGNGKYRIEYQLMVIALHSGVGLIAISRVFCILVIFFLLLAGYSGYRKYKRHVTPCIQLEAFVRRHSLLRELES
ncbi:uncharacterized protein LOC119964200 [Scyliorhinus canicula]|uniref:uncharacterized protein LOC119964200 n=1 Tax=Scyliorhinus canicula TaxID=7830 RepID=UPI0018F5238E|nr:uncharacterized protein LOC119964200 [Scyliorhinus canicula]